MIKPSRSSRKKRIRGKLMGTSSRPRVSVYRSNKFTYAQIIDDETGKTLVSATQKDLKEEKGTKVEKSAKLGEALAEKALKAKIKQVVFDRSGYKYHGRIKAIAESLRAKGIEV